MTLSIRSTLPHIARSPVPERLCIPQPQIRALTRNLNARCLHY